MALSDTVKNAVDAAFMAADDAVKNIVYHRNSANPSYDKITGEVTDNISNVSMQAIFSGYNAFEAANSAIQTNDVKALIPGKYFTFTPQTGTDNLTDPDGIKYDIINFKPDPLKATYTLQLRKVA